MNLNYKHIHILGASGSGTTTMAKEICSHLPFKHFDSDDYFWKTKYTETHSREHRLNSLRTELERSQNWVLSGAVIDWGNPLIPFFDLVIFMSVSKDERLKRLHERESNRYGGEILPEGKRHKEFNKFIDWASQYETGGMNMRSRLQQESWLENLTCDILILNGDTPLKESSIMVFNKIVQ